MKRGLGEIGSLALIAVIGIIVLTSGTLFYGGMFDTYGVGDYEDANTTQITNAYASINESSTTIAENILSSESAGEASYIMLFQGGFEALKQVPNILSGLANMLGGVSEFLTTVTGINVAWLFALLLGGLAIFIAFRFLEIVIGREV